jgi:thiamine-phosphate pyrophosphorylase
MSRGNRGYTRRVIRYAITEGREPGAEGHGVSLDYVQLRAKDLDGGELVARAERLIAEFAGSAKVLVNGRVDVAIAAGADGVHLTGHREELSVEQVRAVFAAAKRPEPVVSLSCHTLEDVARALDAGADLILFGPVFEKQVEGEVVVRGVGLEALREACEVARKVKVLALGGVTDDNAAECVAAGAEGVAGIRLFA